jgi:hypothetical protein
MTLPAFLARLTLKSGPKTGTAIVAWSAQHGDKHKLTSSEVRELWKGTRYKLPSSLGNVTRDLNVAAKKGMLRKEGNGPSLVFYADAYEQEQVEAWATSDVA